MTSKSENINIIKENTSKIAEWLSRNRNVERVFFDKSSEFGNVICFRLKFATLAENFLSGGDTIGFSVYPDVTGEKTSVTYPFISERNYGHNTPCDDEKIILISVGAEDFEEIIADLERILGKNL
ncbi:MAG: PLP-dependent transferase [Clostridia bacterium]|nr:PLP-dependent transferase [Clostridia bacterium]